MRIIFNKADLGDIIKCKNCTKKIAKYTKDDMTPNFQECYNSGNVPIPNFGWFCSQSCANDYSIKYEINFQRNSIGQVDYYENEF